MSANAALINGLEWLSLDNTAGQTYAQSEQAFADYRLATNDEMVEMFAKLMPSFDGDSYGVATNVTGSMYTEALNFVTIFGSSRGYYTYGFYQDETDAKRMVGVAHDEHHIYGVDYKEDYSNTPEHSYFGNYMVQQVPVPATAWLFMSALVGLVGKKRLSRR